MTEKLLYQTLVNKLPGFTWMRIETSTMSGVPDINFFHHETKVEGWLELKIGPIRLRPAQVAWHHRAVKEGRKAFVLSKKADVYELYQAVKCQQWGDTKYFKIVEGFMASSNEIHCITPYLTTTYKDASIRMDGPRIRENIIG